MHRQDMVAAGTAFVPGASHFLRGKVFCGDCGSPFIRRNSGRGKWVKKAWCCRERNKGHGCKMRIILEDDLIHMIEEQVGPIDESFDGRVTVFQDHIEVTGHDA